MTAPSSGGSGRKLGEGIGGMIPPGGATRLAAYTGTFDISPDAATAYFAVTATANDDGVYRLSL